MGVHKGREGNGMEWNDHKGMEWNGMEWNVFKQEKGMEKNGMEWNQVTLIGCFKMKEWKGIECK